MPLLAVTAQPGLPGSSLGRMRWARAYGCRSWLFSGWWCRSACCWSRLGRGHDGRSLP